LVFLAVRAGIGSVRVAIARYGARVVERPSSRNGRAALWTVVLGLGVLAWMNPQLGEERVPVRRRGLDIVFCLDVSRSMLARDVAPDRLERAKRDIRAVLPELVGGDRVALVAFSGEARLVSPLTHDLDAFRVLLESVDTDTVRVGGSDLASALRKAVDVTDPDEAATTVIVMLTDGEDLTGAGRQAAAEVRERGVVLHTVGYGSTRGSKITVTKEGSESFLRDRGGDEVVTAMDPDSLRAMAETAGGEFLRADVMPLPLNELKEKRLDGMVERAYDAGEEVVRRTRYQWVLLPMVLLLLVEFLIAGGVRR